MAIKTRTRRLLLLAALLMSCAAPALAAKALKIVESFDCPYPPNQGITTVEPTGEVSHLAMRGHDPKSRRTTRQKKRLTKKDMSELSSLVRKSGYESMSDGADRFHGRRKRTDACTRSLEITDGVKTKTIGYDSGYDTPPKLEELLKGIDAILDRRPWEPDR